MEKNLLRAILQKVGPSIACRRKYSLKLPLNHLRFVLCCVLCAFPIVRQRLTADVHSTDGGLAERVAGRAPSVGYSDNCTRLVTVSAGVAGSASSGVMVMRVLDELDLGKIMMLTHQV